jgi:hypothetical protein
MRVVALVVKVDPCLGRVPGAMVEALHSPRPWLFHFLPPFFHFLLPIYFFSPFYIPVDTIEEKRAQVPKVLRIRPRHDASIARHARTAPAPPSPLPRRSIADRAETRVGARALDGGGGKAMRGGRREERYVCLILFCDMGGPA